MTNAPDDLDALLAGIREATVRAEQGVHTVIAAATAASELLPSFARDAVLQGLGDMSRDSDAALRQIRMLIDEAGSPSALRAAGAVWTSDVGAAAARLAALPTLGGLRADDYWTGAAADAYRNILPNQQLALTTVKATTDEIDVILNDLASAIITFWTAIIAAIVIFVAALVGAALTAATGIGTPVGVGIAIASVTALAAAVTTAVTSLAGFTNEINGKTAALTRRQDGVLGGNWPRSTVPISRDGSISDGDDTDWHLK